jgi:hypothetical protein
MSLRWRLNGIQTLCHTCLYKTYKEKREKGENSMTSFVSLRNCKSCAAEHRRLLFRQHSPSHKALFPDKAQSAMLGSEKHPRECLKLIKTMFGGNKRALLFSNIYRTHETPMAKNKLQFANYLDLIPFTISTNNSQLFIWVLNY